VRLALSDITIPPFLYFPTHLMESEGPKLWAQVRFLQACQRLNIPQAFQPTFEGTVLKIPTAFRSDITTQEQFSLPPYRTLYESEDEWRRRSREEFEAFLDKWTAVYRKQLALHPLTPIKQTRGETAIELRYEWAAKRYCLNIGFKQMATDKHSANKISKMVAAILEDLGLEKRK
jgi:hypothetical protein